MKNKNKWYSLNLSNPLTKDKFSYDRQNYWIFKTQQKGLVNNDFNYSSISNSVLETNNESNISCESISNNDLNLEIKENSFKEEEMLNRTGGIYTIPQIFINDKYIGGFTDLNLLDIKGKLDKLLKE